MINLLPNEHKKRIEWEMASTKIFKYEIIIFWVIIFAIIGMGAIMFYFQSESQYQKAYLTAIQEKSPELAKIQQSMKEYNQKAAQVNLILGNQINHSDFSEQITNRLQPGMYLKSMNLNNKGAYWAVELSGFSPDADTLFSFKKEIEKIDGAKEIIIPNSAWLKPKDIDFKLDFKWSPKAK